MHKNKHRNVALRLLVGRSLEGGIPWSPDEDQALIAHERALWEALTPEEQEKEQVHLQKLWDDPSIRDVFPDPTWGHWVKDHPVVTISDEAFGLPREHFRPDPMGLLDQGLVPPSMVVTVKWLWSRGFQVVSASTGADDRFPCCALVVSSVRMVAEADRLRGVLATAGIEVSPLDAPCSKPPVVYIRAIYDPAFGKARLDLLGVRDVLFDAV